MSSRLSRRMIIAGGAIAGLGSTMSFGSAQALFPSENLGSGITDSLEPAASSTPTAGQTTAAAEPTASPTSTSTSAPSTSASAKPTTTKKATSKPTAKPTTTTPASGPKDGVYTGAAKPAGIYGKVQVQIRVSRGVVIEIGVPVAPTKDQESIDINTWAIPDLKAAALSSQSANIASLSGATYTSRAFASSLQSALTAAGL